MKIKKFFLLIISMLIMLILVSCGKEPEKVKLMEAQGNIQGLEEYKPASELTSSFGNKVSYEIEDIKWDGNAGLASVTVTTPDLEIIIRDSINNAIESCGTDDYNALLNRVKSNIQETLESDNCPMVNHEVEMEAEKCDDDYTLISNETFEKIIQGNVEDIFLNALTGREQ